MPLVAITVLFIVVLNQDWTDACSCAKTHLQSKFCDAEVAFHGEVLKRTPQLTSLEDSLPSVVLYKMKIVKVYTKTENNALAGTVMVVIKAEDISCNALMHEGHEYLILSKYVENDLEPILCGGVHSFDDLSKEQIHGITGGYNCKCKISMGFSIFGFSDMQRTCYGGIFSGGYSDRCLQKYSSCNIGPQQFCEWETNPEQSECVQNNGYF